jgi:DtxR family transcriptional regulator, Mn-dependent transcriptional regulator
MDNQNFDNISLHQQEYIETIYTLCKSGEHKHAHAKDIAAALNIKMPSVTEALRNLHNMGLINYEVRKAVTLTEIGEKVGVELNKRHQVFSDFFIDILGVDKERAENVACRIEHVIDKEIREVFSEFIDCLKNNVMIEEKNFIEDFKRKTADKFNN